MPVHKLCYRVVLYCYNCTPYIMVVVIARHVQNVGRRFIQLRNLCPEISPHRRLMLPHKLFNGEIHEALHTVDSI